MALEQKNLSLKRPLMCVCTLAMMAMAVSAEAITTNEIVFTTQQDFQSGTLRNIDTSTPGDARIGATKDLLSTAAMTWTVGSKMYSIGADRASVGVIDASTKALLYKIALPNLPSGLPALPAGLAYNPTSNKLYVGNDSGVAVIDTLTDDSATVTTIPGFAGAYPIAFANNKLYVANMSENTVTVISGADDSIITTIPVVIGPHAASFKDGKLYVTNKYNNAVSVIDSNDQVESTILVEPMTGTIGALGLGEKGLIFSAPDQNITTGDRMYLQWKAEELATNQKIEFRIRTANDLIALGAASYAGPDGADSWYSISTPGAESASGGEGITTRVLLPFAFSPYADVMVRLSSDATSTPVLHEVALIYESYPDLQVTSVDAPATGSVAKSISVSSTIFNAGSEAAGSFAVATYLNDGEVTTALACDRTVASLAPGASDAGSVTCAIPGTLSPKGYYLQVCADPGNVITEGVENNNCLLRPITLIQPDLVVTEVASLQPAAPGGSFDASTTVANIGTEAAGAFTVSHYLKVGSERRTLDCVRGIASVDPGSSNTGSLACTMPGDLAAGLYALEACADDPGAILESNEANNCLSGQARVIQPDLVVSDISGPATGIVGKNIDVTVTVGNVGDYSASASSVQIGFDGVTLFCEHPVTTIAPGSSATVTATCTIPSSLTAGTYSYRAVADGNNVVNESNESNNERVQGLIDVQRPKPDFTITEVTGPASIRIGTAFNVTTAVNNLADSYDGSFNIKMYLISSAGFSYYSNPANPLNEVDALSCDRTVYSLGAGQSNSAVHSCVVPNGADTGQYYLLAVADPANAVEETNESNNRGFSAVKLPLYSGPVDLVVTEVTGFPATASVGQQVALTATHSNLGYESPQTSAYVVRLCYSKDETFPDCNTKYFQDKSGYAVAGPGYSSTYSYGFAWPDLPAGTYFVGAYADATNMVPEYDEANNTLAYGTIEVICFPDLVVTGMTGVPAAVASGGWFNSYTTVKNQGTGSSKVSYNSYLWSTDPTFATIDGRFDSTYGISALGAGASATPYIRIYVPALTKGTTYYFAAMADYKNATNESNESNNILPLGTMLIQ